MDTRHDHGRTPSVTALAVMMLLLALVVSPVLTPADASDDHPPALTRPIADFLEKQGQHLTKGIVPEFISFTAYFNPTNGTNRAVSIDYAGLGAKVIKQKTHGAVNLRTKMEGIVYERPLPDGRAEVTIRLHTRHALSFAITEPAADYDALGQPIFGYRPHDIVADFQADGQLDVTPSVGNSFLHVVLLNPAVGADLPDLVVFLGLASPLPGQELVSISMFADAHGTVHDDQGDQPGALQVMMASDLDFSFPVEEILIRAFDH
jgi:hypothetical protein